MTAVPPPNTMGRNSRVRWIVLALIILASFISYVLRSNMSIVAPTMKTDLGLTEVQLGMVFSAFAAGYAIFQFPAGVFGGLFGSRLAIATIAVVWGVLTIATGLIPGSDAASIGVVVASLVALRFLVGVSHAPIFPVTGGTTADWFPIGHWGLPLGLSSTGLTLGAAATAPLIVWLVDAYGWRGSFFLTAPAAFLLAAAWWWFVRDYPRDHPKVSPRELALIDANRPPPQSHAERKGAWKKVLKNRDILLLTASYFCMNYIFYLFFNWFFFYVTDVKGFSEQEAGMLTAALWVVGAVGATIGGFSCDRFIGRFGLRQGPRILSITSLILSGLFLVLGATASGLYATVSLLCLSFGFTQITEAGSGPRCVRSRRRFEHRWQRRWLRWRHARSAHGEILRLGSGRLVRRRICVDRSSALVVHSRRSADAERTGAIETIEIRPHFPSEVGRPRGAARATCVNAAK
jgi:ACS family glucarate transporter-like MFS transporter